MTPLKPATGEGGVAGLPIQCSTQGLVPGFAGFPSWLSLNGGEDAVTERAAGRFLSGSLPACWGLSVTAEKRYALLVEDELLVAMVAADALDELGFHVLEASSAARALALAQAHQGAIEFAMVDLGLPDRPGEELVCELRGLYPNLPIIIASGKGAGAVDGSVRSLANIAFLTKPYDFEVLRATIERMSGGAAAN
jgi:CheY-like chemotaxis protein